jgi:RNA polymerase sigma factor (sigma-70 family)
LGFNILQKVDRALTSESFNKLLGHLDVDLERAGEKYELIRFELVKFFECRGCVCPQELSDEVINRVARNIMTDKEVPSESVSGYFYGVARNVLREYLRSPERRGDPLDELQLRRHPSQDPAEVNERKMDRARRERKLECLEACAEELPPETRKLIISYYEGEESVKIRNRKRIAEDLGIELNNLRIRVHRIRERLEKCVVTCMSNSHPE